MNMRFKFNVPSKEKSENSKKSKTSRIEKSSKSKLSKESDVVRKQSYLEKRKPKGIKLNLAKVISNDKEDNERESDKIISHKSKIFSNFKYRKLIVVLNRRELQRAMPILPICRGQKIT